MHDVQHAQDNGLPELDAVAEEEHGDDDQVQQDEDRFARNDPPINQCGGRHDQVEDALAGRELRESYAVGNLPWTTKE